jgi:hypothetical protein
MKRWGVMLLLAGCASENPDLVIERQPAPVAQATDAAWKRGSVILAGEPGTFTFPQPLALRFTIVDDAAAEMPAPQLIAKGKVALSGAGQAQVTVDTVCQPMYCTAEVSITGMGETMLAVTADGPSGGERDCFYYAVVDASTDTAALQAELETRQRDCRFAAE